MRFVVSRQELIQLIRKIQTVVPQNPPIPILSHFLLEAQGDQLTVVVTNLTVGARSFTTQAKIFEEGSLAIPFRLFFQLLRELTESTIEVSCDPKEMAEITAGSSHFRLHGIHKNEYPSLPDLAESVQFTIPSEELKEMLFRTAFSVSKDDTRYGLTGLLMSIHNQKALFIGTDGKRLAKNETSVRVPEDFSGDYILPIKAVEEILKLLSESTHTTIYLTADKVGVELGNVLLITKLLSTDYPNFQQIIESPCPITLTLHREELMTLLRQISLFVPDANQSARFTFDRGELLLTARSVETGEGKVSMPVHFSAGKLEIAFNPHYFIDILRHVRDETITLSLSDAYNPGKITDSTASTFILMPMRLNE